MVNLPPNILQLHPKEHSCSLSPNWLLHRKLFSFSNQATSTFWQISLDNFERKLMHPKSCGVSGGRRKASGISLKQSYDTCEALEAAFSLAAVTPLLEMSSSHRSKDSRAAKVLWQRRSSPQRRRVTPLFGGCLGDQNHQPIEPVCSFFQGFLYLHQGFWGFQNLPCAQKS